MKRYLFPKGDNNYNEIEFSLASIEVLNSKITQNLSQWNANRYILFLIMYVLHLNWLKSYMLYVCVHIEKNLKDATLRNIVIFSFLNDLWIGSTITHISVTHITSSMS